MPGKNKAIASMVLGIVAVVFGFIGIFTAGLFALVGVVCGIVGLVLASLSKKEGMIGGMQTAGFVLSLLGLIFGGIVFVSCLACVGCASCGALSTLPAFMY